MISDIWTVLRKELKEILGQRTTGRAGSRGGWLNLLVIVGVFGVFMPLQFGREWATSPMLLLAWAWVPLFLVSSVTADAFAGERERHTLETLLASRLSDRAILLGKVGGAMAYGWGLTLAALLLGLVTINVAYGREGLLLYPIDIAAAGLALSFLGSGLSATVGVLISLRASSARQAAQTMGLAIMALVLLPTLGLQALPAAWKASAAQMLLGASVNQLALGAVVILLILDGLFLAAALLRFQRAKLILD